MSHSPQTFISFKIDVTKILKEHMYHSTKPNPKNGGKCPVYLDCIVWENKQGEDDYGNTHYIVQSVSKEARAKGVKGPIIGNMTIPASAAPAKAKAKFKPVTSDDDDDGEDGSVPF